MSRAGVRLVVLALALVGRPPAASAEWQIKPFLGATFGGDTSFVSNFDQVAGNPKLAVGVNATLLGEILGVEADLGRTPGFFSGDKLVLQSSVTTLTGNVVVAMPRRMTQYSLRPYVVAGGGLMAVRIEDKALLFPVSSNKPAVDVGAGATGFLTNRIGWSWDVRYFRNVGGGVRGNSIGEEPEQLSFWRATMALAIRY